MFFSGTGKTNCKNHLLTLSGKYFDKTRSGDQEETKYVPFDETFCCMKYTIYSESETMFMVHIIVLTQCIPTVILVISMNQIKLKIFSKVFVDQLESKFKNFTKNTFELEPSKSIKKRLNELRKTND